MIHLRVALALALIASLGACGSRAKPADVPKTKDGFPVAARPVASIVSDRWSSEAARDKAGEANAVMDKAGIRPGMTVADIGAGEGYYTIRLAARVGDEGRVLAEDIVAGVRDKLAERVVRERLDNVSVRLGLPANPKLPPDSFDRVMMVHMYHEIADPYEFLWTMRPALKPEGRVVVVDSDKPTDQHGTPKKLLACEFGAVGFKQVDEQPMPSAGGYMAIFKAVGPRPAPAQIRACTAAGNPA